MTIAEQTRGLAEAQAAAPSDEVMSAFAHDRPRSPALEPAGVIAIGRRCRTANCWTPRAVHDAVEGARGPSRGARVLPGRVVPVLQHRAERLPGRAAGRARASRRHARGRQPADAGRVAEHAGEERPSLRGPLRSRQSTGAQRRDPHGAIGGGTRCAAQLGLDLEAVNADGTTALPMPTVLILDPDLTVRWVDVHPDYTTRSEPAEILAALDAITA